MYFRKIPQFLALFSLVIPCTANAGTAKGPLENDAGPDASATASPVAEAAGDAALPATQRPLSDWLKAQGTSVNYFPPIGDYLGWTDGPFKIFALIDYAGVANRDIKDIPGYRRSFGTQVKGVVIEEQRPDNTVRIIVDTSTTQALGFAQSIEVLEANNFDFANTPTIFGTKAVDSAEPALGSVKFHVSFVNPAPGDPLPDLVDVAYDNICDFVPYEVSIDSSTTGTRPDGTRAVMRVHQVGALSEEDCRVKPKKNKPTEAKFSIETIEIIDLGKTSE